MAEIIPSMPFDEANVYSNSDSPSERKDYPLVQPQKKVVFQPGKIGLNFVGNEVGYVEPRSQAEKLGILKGWILLTVKGQQMPGDADLIIHTIRSYTGQSIEMTFAVLDSSMCQQENVPVPPIDIVKSSSYASAPIDISSRKLSESISSASTLEGVEPKYIDVRNQELDNTFETISFQAGPIGIGHRGNLVDQVIPNSAAFQAGVLAGWRILLVNKVKVRDDTSCVRDIIRQARDLTGKIELKFDKSERKRRAMAVTFQPGSIGLRHEGTMVTEIVPGSQSDQMGICVGWRIESVNGQPQFDDTEQLDAAIDLTYQCNKPTNFVFVNIKTSPNIHDTNKISHKKRKKLSVSPKISPKISPKKQFLEHPLSEHLPSENLLSEHVLPVTFHPGPIGMRHRGALVTEIAPGSQADRAGIRVGMHIESVNGERQPDNTKCIDAALDKTYKHGKPTTILFTPTATVPVTRTPNNIMESKVPSDQMSLVTKEYMIKGQPALSVTFPPGRLGIGHLGTLVTEVMPGSQAERAGILIGWRIESVNGQLQIDDTSLVDAAIDRTYIYKKPTNIVFLKQNPAGHGTAVKNITKSELPIRPTVSAIESVMRFPSTGRIGIGHQGNVVHSISNDSVAENLGVRIGWLIVSVNGIKVSNNTNEIRAIINEERNRIQMLEIVFITHETVINFPSGSTGIGNKGYLVQYVIPFSMSAKINVKIGWMIKSVNGHDVPNDTRVVRAAIRRARDLRLGTQIVFDTQDFQDLAHVKSSVLRSTLINSCTLAKRIFIGNIRPNTTTGTLIHTLQNYSTPDFSIEVLGSGKKIPKNYTFVLVPEASIQILLRNPLLVNGHQVIVHLADDPEYDDSAPRPKRYLKPPTYLKEKKPKLHNTETPTIDLTHGSPEKQENMDANNFADNEDTKPHHSKEYLSKFEDDSTTNFPIAQKKANYEPNLSWLGSEEREKRGIKPNAIENHEIAKINKKNEKAPGNNETYDDAEYTW